MNARQTTLVLMRLLAVASLLLPGAGSAWAQATDGSTDEALAVAGSPGDYWRAGALAGTAPAGPRFLLDFIRAMEAMELHDPTRLRTVHEYLAAPLASRGQANTSFRIPTPLRAAVWSGLVSSNRSSDLFSAAMSDRRARRLLYGAAALDPATRAYVESRPALVERLFRNHSDVFAVLGRSVHVRGGKVEVPGGPAAVELWELLVGASTGAPDVFVDRLLAADTGELAALYDAVAHLDGPHQRFVLSLWMPDASRRRARALTLYRAARAAGRRVLIPHQPFVRTELDLLTVVSQFRVMEDGRPAAPAAPSFWRAVFARAERWPDAEWSGPPDDITVDATWLVETIMLSARPIWAQMATIAFAQRLLGPVPGAPGPKAPDDAVFAVRLFPAFASLILALERAGIRDIRAYTVAVGQAAALKASGRMYWHRQLLVQYQGALALIAQLRASDRLSVPAAERLIGTLSSIPPFQDRAFAGGVAGWIAHDLLPALGVDPASIGDGESEYRLLVALTGSPRDAADIPGLRWEDWDYRIDPALVPLGRLQKIRARQAGNSLDAVLRVWQAAAQLPGAGNLPRGRVASPPALPLDTAQMAAALRAAAAGIREPRGPTDGTGRDAPNVAATLAEAAGTLERLREGRQSSQVAAVGQRVMSVVDVLTADVILSLLYAVHIGDPASPLWLEGDVAYRHDFGLTNRDDLDLNVLAWSFPIEQPANAWHVRGSLFDLDVALARLRLPQVAAGGPPAPPVLAPDDQRVFVESVALFNPDRYGDPVMQAIGDAVRAGRERVSAAAGSPDALDRLAAIGHVSEWRRYHVLPWLAVHDPQAVPSTFSLTELYWVGITGRASMPPGVDAWGASAFPVGGCRCLRVPSPQAWEDVAGRTGGVPSVVADGTLRLAELLSALRLPSVLARHLFPVLMREFLDRVPMVHSDDWMSVTRYWAAVPRDRIEDAMGRLTVEGPLMAGGAPPAQ